MLESKRTRSVLLAATAAVAASLPATAAHATAVPPDSGCSGYYVTPAKPATEDWAPGTNLKFVNCTKTDRFVNVMCHPSYTIYDDTLCWTRRVNAYTIVSLDVPSTRQVHAVRWY